MTKYTLATRDNLRGVAANRPVPVYNKYQELQTDDDEDESDDEMMSTSDANGDDNDQKHTLIFDILSTTTTDDTDQINDNGGDGRNCTRLTITTTLHYWIRTNKPVAATN